MTNSVDPDQTAPIEAVSAGFTLFNYILKFVSNVRQLFAADDFSRRHFQIFRSIFSWRFKGLIIVSLCLWASDKVMHKPSDSATQTSLFSCRD